VVVVVGAAVVDGGNVVVVVGTVVGGTVVSDPRMPLTVQPDTKVSATTSAPDNLRRSIHRA
jgi:hypothetical protein